MGKKEGGREREKRALSFVSSLPKCSPKSQAGLDLASRTKNSVLVYCAREGGGRENGQRPNYLIYNLMPSRLCISKKLGNLPNECEFWCDTFWYIFSHSFQTCLSWIIWNLILIYQNMECWHVTNNSVCSYTEILYLLFLYEGYRSNFYMNLTNGKLYLTSNSLQYKLPRVRNS